MSSIQITKSSLRFAESYNKAVDTVARERKHLGNTVGFPLDSTISFVKMFEENNLAQFFAMENERVVGWCDIQPKPFEGMKHVGVLGMGILREFRGKGLGSKLLEKALNHAKTVNGIEKVELEVFKSNAVAIRLYERFGFVIEGERVKGRKLDGIYDNILLMGKEI